MDKRCYQLRNGGSGILVCLLSDNGTVLSRGVSTHREEAVREVEASSFAKLALNERRNMCLIDNDDELVALMEVLDDETNFIKEDGMYRGIFRPVLTRYEEELLGRCRR